MYVDFNFSISLLTFIYLITDILVGGKWYLSVVLIHITLMIKDSEYLFMCLLAIYIFYVYHLEKF